MRLHHPICVATVLLWTLHGCRTPTVPSPVVFHDGRIDPCARIPPEERTNQVQILYATSRCATGNPSNPTYSNDVTDELKLGTATVQFGGDDTTWDQLCAMSRGNMPVSKMPMRVTAMQEMARLSDAATPSEREWAEVINRQLDRTPNKQVNLYVHGCATHLVYELPTAAQFFHFAGRGGAMIVFGWPSQQKLSLYKSD